METLSFAFGVLSMIGLLFVITIVIGAVKVIKQGNQIEGLHEQLRYTHEEIDRRFDQLNRDKDMNMEYLERTIQTNYSETISYTDSRLDKLEQKLTGALGTKQIVKG